MSDPSSPPNPNGPRTLDGKPAEALPEGWGQRAAPRLGRIGQWSGSGPSTPGRPNVSREGTQSPRPTDQQGNELYTGGERSGLAVQAPGGGRDTRGVVDDILEQARSGGTPTEPSPSRRSPWSGVGHTVGSDENPSESVGAADSAEEEVQRRTFTFWRDGFSIEDGPLYRYDVPANQELLAAIKAGRAPASLFNVGLGQPLELVVQQRTGEDYAPPPKKPAAAFSGAGHRLGAVIPNYSAASAALSSSAAGAAQNAPPKPEIKVDPSKPSTSVQIRLADGSRLVAKVNTDASVADLRAFIQGSRPNETRPFILQTTFPSRELGDAETIASAKLANSVIVQRFP